MRSTNLQSDSIGLSSANVVMRAFYTADNRAGEWGVLMHVKPIGWEFTPADFCCPEFRSHAFVEGYDSPELTVSRNGVSVLYRGTVIDYCPFCGKKIELEKVQI